MGEPRTTPSRAGLAALLERGGALVVSGAGISTGSGIPDYRGPDGRHRDDRPMTIDRFLESDAEQQAYWARSHIGWERFRRAAPNTAHRAVTDLQRAGLLCGVVTQNVDGLHPAAGTTDVIEIHGRLDEVVCLDCDEVTGRDLLAERLDECNPGFREQVSADETAVRPDGDILLHPRDVARFTFVGCATCGGRLKPGVVMFGEQVPRDRYARARGLVDEAQALIVLGSSLSVGSGYRFVLDAARRGIPIAIVTRGRTRGDAHATIQVDDDLCAVLPAVAREVAGTVLASG
ncbi:MAG: NAD-dependent deacetylase [Actinomycetota bacterium]|nr:NAD-dependent deacetylase [Actinomycetota bacterium]